MPFSRLREKGETRIRPEMGERRTSGAVTGGVERPSLADRHPQSAPTMKCSIDIECTPEEARTFLGLPDLQPMQARLMAEMERRMLAEVDRFSPEAMMKTWLSLAPQSSEQMQDWMARLFQGGTTRS